MLVLLAIAFLAGVITALSPCVLPGLPLLLAGSAASESRWRPYAVMAGLVVSFTTFTLVGAALLSALGLPQDLRSRCWSSSLRASSRGEWHVRSSGRSCS